MNIQHSDRIAAQSYDRMLAMGDQTGETGEAHFTVDLMVTKSILVPRINAAVQEIEKTFQATVDAQSEGDEVRLSVDGYVDEITGEDDAEDVATNLLSQILPEATMEGFVANMMTDED